MHISHWCAGYKGEGWFDPWMLLSSFKKKAISLGVDFIPGDVTGISVEGNKVKSIEVHAIIVDSIHASGRDALCLA